MRQLLETSNLTEIPNAFGSATYTPVNTSGNSLEIKKTIDIKNFLNMADKN